MTPTPTSPSSPREEEWRPYFEEWKGQGRTEEQTFGVLNFMTGQGQKMLDDIRAAIEERMREEIRAFLSGSSVWDEDYVYIRKAKMLDSFDEKFKALREMKEKGEK